MKSFRFLILGVVILFGFSCLRTVAKSFKRVIASILAVIQASFFLGWQFSIVMSKDNESAPSYQNKEESKKETEYIKRLIREEIKEESKKGRIWRAIFFIAKMIFNISIAALTIFSAALTIFSVAVINQFFLLYNDFVSGELHLHLGNSPPPGVLTSIRSFIYWINSAPQQPPQQPPRRPRVGIANSILHL
jgi:hypothetical protein